MHSESNRSCEMNIKFLNDSALLNHTKAKASEERKLTLEVIECLQEIYHRRLHLEKYPSLHVFCVKEYGYSDSEADARIKAMRLVEDLPETKNAIGEGRLSLTTAAQIQRFFLRQEKRSVDLEPEAKQKVVESLAGKSKLETEKELIALGLELGDSEIVLRERERVVTPEITEIKVFVPQELKVKLEKLKSLLSHKYSNSTNLELLTELAEIGLEKLDPERRALRSEHRRSLGTERAERNEKTERLVRSERTERSVRSEKIERAEPAEKSDCKSPSRYIPSVVRHYVWMRDRGVCTHRDPKTQKKCESNFRLQYDHIEPFSLGGASIPENLRLLCQSHSTPEQALNKGVRIPRPELFIHGSSRRLFL